MLLQESESSITYRRARHTSAVQKNAFVCSGDNGLVTYTLRDNHFIKSFSVKRQYNFAGERFGDIVDIVPRTRFIAKLDKIGCREYLGQIWIEDHLVFLNKVTSCMGDDQAIRLFRALDTHLGLHRDRINPDCPQAEDVYVDFKHSL